MHGTRVRVTHNSPESGRLSERILGNEVSLLRVHAAELEIVGQDLYYLCQSNCRGALERRESTGKGLSRWRQGRRAGRERAEQ
jgi:hypothetical protein